MGEFQTFNGCHSNNEEWVLLRICKALIKNAGSFVLLMLPVFRIQLFIPGFGVYAIVQQ